VPLAKGMLVDAARKVSVDDAIRIVRGSSTSVTEYFAGQTREPQKKIRADPVRTGSRLLQAVFGR
jgi:hypothetical protein